jgi:hypothetical protein
MAMRNKGIVLGRLERPDEEIAVYDQMVSRYGGANDSELQAEAALALIYKGITLETSGRVVDADAAYDEVVRRFGDATQPAVRAQVKRAIANKQALPRA